MANGIKLAIIITSIFVVLGLAGFGIYLGVGGGQATISQPLTEYTCPEDNVCTVTALLQCDVATNELHVRVRTNALIGGGDFKDDYEDKWVTADIYNTGELSRFANGNYHPTRSSSRKCDDPARGYIQLKDENGFPLINADGYKFTYYEDRNELYVYASCSSSGFIHKWVSYEATASPVPDTSPTPKEPYKSAFQEVYSGEQTVYSCQRNLIVAGVGQPDLIYNSNNPTSVEGKKYGTYVLAEGESIVSNTGTGVFRIKYDEVYSPEPVTECLVDIDGSDVILKKGQKTCKDANTLVTCINPPTVSEEYRDPEDSTDRCVNDAWTEAYTVSVTLDESVISLGEKFTINFDLDDNQYEEVRRDVTAELYSGSSLEDSDSGLTDSRGRTTLELYPKTTGFKQINIYMYHPERPYDPEPIEVRVTEALEISTFRTQSPQFDNGDIIIVVEATKDNENKDIDDWEIDDKYNGQSISPRKVKRESRGVYHFLYGDIEGDGDLQFRIKATDNTGFQTDWEPNRGYTVVEVKKAEILFKEESYPFSVCDGRTYIGTMTLVDSSGNKVTGASVSVTVTDPDGDKSNPAVTEGSNGEYSFSHFLSEGGNYYIDVVSTKGALRGTSLNNPVNILSCSGSGGFGGIGEEAGIDWLMWALIGVAIISVGGFVYFVFIRKKKN